MFYRENQKNSIPEISDTISLPNKSGGTRAEILNALIKELRAAQLDIQKIAFFEHPLEAVVQIRNPNRPKKKPSFIERLTQSRERKTSPIFLKLGIARRLNTQSPFLLKYEILPRVI